ncbi:MAG: tetratricopeptide repeat protein [Acidobacteria bacterium]|nr:tetratricopeptide repeat protein [Acidobacteriota bacterium]
MNGAHDRPIRKFNPGTLQSDDEVVRQFVVRHRELDLVLDVLRGNLDSSSCQHVLIVAPRGRGKTMLLARVGVELRTNADLTGRLFPVRFMEESQEVFTMADFWIEALFYLAQACAQAGDAEHSRELLATHGDLNARWNDGATEDRAHAAVLEAAERLGRRLVLMVENLQALSNAVDDDFGWKLRKTLQAEPQVVLLATATSRFKGLDDAAQPFFEQFRIVDLEPLDTDECRYLWHMVSGDVGQGREIEPLRILTGGSPRLLAIVAELARHASLRQLLEDLVTLIDNHTEYFRGHLDVLAKTERRVYLAVIDLWQPSSTAEIAARARTDVRAVSALLGRLVDRGAVLVEGTGRKRRYAAAERLYSIYYKLRRERGEAAIVRHLIQFMTVFYSGDELAALAVSDRGKARLGTSAASDLQLEVTKALVNKGIAHGKRGETEAELSAYEAVVERFGDSSAPDLQVVVARALVNKGITHGQRGEVEAELSAYDAVVERFGDSGAPDLQVQVAKALVNKGITHGQRGEVEAELSAYDAVVERFGDSGAPDLQVRVAKALFNKGITHGQRGEMDAALAAYGAVVERFGDSGVPDVRVVVARALLNKGTGHGQRGEAEAELSVYDAVVKRFGDSVAPDLQVVVAKALVNKGITHGQRGEVEAELSAYAAVVGRFGASDRVDLQRTVAVALVATGDRQVRMGRPKESLQTIDDLQRRCGTLTDDARVAFELWRAHCVRAHALLVQGERDAALNTWRSICAAFVDDARMLREMLARVPVLLDAGAAARDLADILAEDGETADAVAPLIIALRQVAGQSVRAPAEVLEVAAHVRERIEAAIAAPRSPSPASASPDAPGLPASHAGE